MPPRRFENFQECKLFLLPRGRRAAGRDSLIYEEWNALLASFSNKNLASSHVDALL